jgi:hypothetical protein
VDSNPQLCRRCQTPLEHGDLRCSICSQAAPRDLAAPQHTEVQILRCTGCGAAIGYDPKHQAPSCSFCDSVVKLEIVEDPLEQTQGYLPFTVSPQAAGEALQNWLGSLGWFRPSDLRSSAQLLHLRPLWWVAWVFDADSCISWAADSDAGRGRSQWSPHASQSDVRFRRILASASRGLTLAEVAAISGGMNLDSVQAEPLGADKATLEQFDVPRSQARQQVVAALHAMADQHVRQHEIPGGRFRNVHVSVVVQGLVTRRLSLPAYVLAYRYKRELYRVVICGQDAQRIIGKAPYSTAKIVLAVIAIAGLLMLLLSLIAS